MTPIPVPAPAYVAHIDALPCSAIANVGLGGTVRPAVLDALNGLTVPIAFTAGRFTPLEQVQLAIQGAAAAFLPKLGLSAVLWQEREGGEVGGDLSVWHQGRFKPIATVSVVPAPAVASAA